MATRATALTEMGIRAAKPSNKAYKLFDGGGLFLLLSPNGSRLWRVKYRFQGREKLLALGSYPEVSLKLARERRDASRKLVAADVDPGAKRQAEKGARAHSFAAVSLEWLELQRASLTVAAYKKSCWLLKDLLFPALGSRPVGQITAPEVLAAVRRIEARGRHETAHRAKWKAGQVFRYAISTGRAERDPTADLRGALAPVVTTNRAAITDPKRIGELMRSIAGYRGQASTEGALKLAALVFVRPGELRNARWEEFDLDASQPVWRIPAERMKMGEEHLVPLARQVVALLKDLQQVTGPGGLVFPGIRSGARPISDNTINAALRGLGYGKEEMTAHGFRAMASTVLNELGYAPDIIELQLAHQERNKVRAAYNRAQRLAERRKMMQVWADHLDALRDAKS